MLFLIALLVFLSVFLVTVEVVRARPVSLRRRVGIDESSAPAALESTRTDGSLIDRVFMPGVGRVGSRIAGLLPQNAAHGIERLLISANAPWSMAGYLAVWAMSVAAGALLWLYVSLSIPELSGVQFVVLGFGIMSLAILLPYARVRSMARARKRAIVRALPDALDLLVTSVEAGMGVDAAFAMVVEKTEGPLSDTFSQYLKLVGLGRPRREALLEVSDRAAVDDLIVIANSVSQGEELGTPVGDVLRAQASNLRALRRERAQARAQRAPVLMTIPIALCFLPAMGAVVVVPSILNLVQFVGNLGN